MTASGTGTGTTGTDSWTAGTDWSTAPVSGSSTVLVFLPTGGTFSNITPLIDNSTNDLVAQPFLLNVLTLGGTGSATAAATSTINILSGTLDFVDNGLATPVLNLAAINGVGVTYNVASAIALSDNLTISGSSNATFNLSGIISGTGAGPYGVTMSATGAITLGGINSYSGTTTINSGTIKISGSNALGSGAATNVINLNGGVLESTANTYNLGTTRTITLGGNSTIQTDGGALTISGNVNDSAGNLLTITGGGATIISGTIGSGTNGITKNGGGTLTLSATNSYQGLTTINAGTVLIGSTYSLGTQGGAGAVLNGGLLGFTGGTNALVNNFTLGAPGSGFTTVAATDLLTLSGTLSATAITTTGPGAISITGSLIGSGTSDLAFTVGSTGTTAVSGTISNGGGFGLQKIGSGALLLSSTENYSGNTTVTAGALLVTNPGVLGTQGIAGLVFNGGLFGFASGTNTLTQNFTLGAVGSGFISVNPTDDLILSGTLSGNNVNFAGSGTTNVTGAVVGPGGANTFTFGVNGSGVPIISGTISNGSGNVAMSGTGTLVITGSQNYTGTTNPEQGTIAFGPGGALSPTGQVVLGGSVAGAAGLTSGTLQLGYSGGADNLTVAGLSGTVAGDAVVGGNTTTGTLTINNTSSTGTYGGAFGGGGTNQNNLAILFKGGGNFNLGGADTATGGMTIESGTVAAIAVNQLGPSGGIGIRLGDQNTGASNATLYLGTAGNNYNQNITTTNSAVSGSLSIITTTSTLLTGTITLNDNLYYSDAGVSATIGNATSAITGTGNLIINAGVGVAVNFNGTTGMNAGWTGSLIVNSGTVSANGSNDPYSATITVAVNTGAQWGGPNGLGNSSDVIAGFQNGANGGGTVFINRMFQIAGSGSYNFGGSIITNNSGLTFTKNGTGIQVFSGSVNLVKPASSGYTVNINSGTLELDNPLGSTVSGTTGASSFTDSGTITISTGNPWVLTGTQAGSPVTVVTGSNAMLQVTGNYLITGAPVLVIKGGNGTSSGQGTLSLWDGQINTLVLQTSAANGTNILTMGNTAAGSPSLLDLEVGSSSDQIDVGVGGVDKMTVNNNSTGGVEVNLIGLGGLNGTTQVLLESANTAAFTTGTIGSGANFVIGTSSGNFGGYTIALSSTLVGGTAELLLTETPGTAASSGSSFYWTGAQGNGLWNSFSGGTNNFSNWSLSSSGTPDAEATPSSINDVIFSGSNGANLNTTLGQNQSIKGLFFTTVPGAAVTIGGTNTLTVGVDGINVQAGSGATTINSNLATNGNQTWNLNNPTTSPLAVNGNFTETNNVTTAGSGELLLGGSDTISGTLTIGGATSVVLNNANALNSTATGALAFGPSSTGTLNLNGFNASVGSLSSNATVGSPVIRNGAATSDTLTVVQAISGTYGGVIRDGTGGGSLSLVKNGAAILTLTGSNSYSGTTAINAGELQVDGYTGAGNVTVNSSGTLSGYGGRVGGAVSVNSGGVVTVGVPAATGTLALANGLTINSGGIAAFNLAINGTSHDEINIISGGLTLANGSIIEVTSGVYISGTYALMTYTGPDPAMSSGTLVGVTEESLTGGALSTNYSFVANGGTLDLVVAPSPLAIPGLTLSAPTSGIRVMSGTTVGLAGQVTNSGTQNPLEGVLSSATGASMTTSGFTSGSLSSGTLVVGASGTANFTASIATGTHIGYQSYGVTVSDTAASPTSQTVTGSLDVLGNRVVQSSTVNLGYVHVRQAVSGTVTLTTTGNDNQYTEVYVGSGTLANGNSNIDANGVTVTGGNTSLVYNGPSSTDTRIVSGTLVTSGTLNGAISLVTTSAENGGPLAGESDINVVVDYTAVVFSGTATWTGGGTNGVWSTGSNWVNAGGGIPGAPGLSGSYSIGDTATFIDGTNEIVGGTTTINLAGVNPSLAALTFSSGSTVYNLTSSSTTSGTLFMQTGGTMNITTGTALISTSISGTGALTVSGSAGTDLIWSGTGDGAFTGSVNLTSGTLTLVNPSWLGQLGGQNIYNVASGAALQWNIVPSGSAELVDQPNQSGTIEGSGTVQVTGTGDFFLSNAKISLLMSAGGILEVENGATLTSGGNGGGGLVTGNNLGTLQLDTGGSINVWNNGQFTVDALIGTGTVNRIGYGNGAGSGITVGSANGSGTFNGTITNTLGTLDFIKMGSGTETLTGSNTYSGSTWVNGNGAGTLRITTGYALGATGLTFVSQPGQHTTTVSGTGTLDLYGGITLNNAVTLSAGALVNSAAGTTSVLDSGIAGITFTTDPGVSGTGFVVTFSGGSGTGAAATGSFITGSVNLTNVYNFAGSAGPADYAQMTNAGSGYTVTNAPTVSFIITGTGGTSGTATTGSDAVVVSQLDLTGTNNTIGGAGNLIINAQMLGAGGGFTKTGTGSLTLTGSETYTGMTYVGLGNLINNGFLTGSVTVNAAGGVFSGTGTVGGALTTSAGTIPFVANIAPGNNTSGNFGGAGTLTVLGGMTLAATTQLDFDIGANSDLIAVTGQLTLGSGITLDVNEGSGFSLGTPYTLITYTGALTGNTSGWTISGSIPTQSTAVLSSGSGTVTLTFVPINPPANAYWSGAQGVAGTGTWATFAGGTNYLTNWVSAISGGTDTNQVPYLTTNVFFIADTGSNVNTYLGSNFIINSLNFSGTDNFVTTGSNVSITGSSPGSGANFGITLEATGSNGNVAGVGLTTGTGAGADTINANITIASNQTWVLNASPTSPLTIGGTISGAHALTLSGSGEIILNGNDTFSGGLTVDNSVNVVLGNTGALNSTESLTFGPSSTGTVNLNGNSVTIGSLSSNSTPGSPVIRNGNATPATLTIDQTVTGTYAGVMRDGAGGGSLGLTYAGPASLYLTGANTFSGATVINGGLLQVNGSLSNTSGVTVNSGTLGGSGGSVSGMVTINSGGVIAPTLGTSGAPGTLTLSGGLTIQTGGIAEFHIINGGANDSINITSGGLSLANGSIIEVSPYLTIGGTYALFTYTGANPSLSNVTEEVIGGGAVAGNYSFVANGGTLELVVTQSPVAIPILTITSATSGRVMSGTNLTVTGSVSNVGTVNTLSGSFSSTGSLAISNFSPGVASVAPQTTIPYSGTLATGTNLGVNPFSVTITDGSATPTSQTVGGTFDVVANRVVVSSTNPAFGSLHAGATVSGTIILSSTGADSQYTRVKVGDAGPDANGISITGGNTSGTFNGSFTDSRVISGSFSSLGAQSGTITLVTTGEGLAGESPINVVVNYTANVFSGHATWSGIAGNSNWATATNWGDTNINDLNGAGAPGLSGSLSLGDTVVLTDGTSEVVSGTTPIYLNGANPSLASLTFSSGSTVYDITGTTGTGTLNIQNSGSLNVTTGKGVIAAALTGSGLTVNVAPGSDLLITGSSMNLSGTTTFVSGTTTFGYPGLLTGAQAAVYVTDAGATLELSATTAQNIAPGGAVTFSGSGTLLKTGTAILENHAVTMAMTGGTIEIAAGVFDNAGNGGGVGTGNTVGVGNPGTGAGNINWTNNKASLQIDSGATVDTWDGATIIVDALTGSGTFTKYGYGEGTNNLTIGVNNGSGTFAGTITNSQGTVSLTKLGSGLEVLSGSNSYSGATIVTGSNNAGTLRITNNNALGFGGQAFQGSNGFTTTVSGSGTLDISGNLDINNAVTLFNGSLINSAVGTTGTLDSGIAGVTFTHDPNAGPYTISLTGGSGTGATVITGTLNGSGFPNLGGNAIELYTQMTAAGSGYSTGTGAPTVTFSGGTSAGTVAAVVSSLTLQGNNFIGGNGDLQINAQIVGSGGFTTVGSGTVILANAETYTGSTVLAAGSTLELGTGYSGVSSITGAGSVVVAGNGTQIFAGLNTYTGTTGINSGATLQLGNGLNDGAIVSSTVSVNGALVFDTAGNENLPAVITGTGGITMIGVGNQEISGSNNFTGATTVNSGTLQIGNVNALSKTSGITVGGAGSLSVSNGVTPQTFTLSGSGQVLTMTNGASLDFGVSNTGNDELVISGSASTALSGTITINLGLLSGTGQSTPFTIISDASNGLGSATFVLGQLPALSSGTIVSVTASTVEVEFTGVTTVYWTGIDSGNWSDYNNFSSDITGTIPLTGTFGPAQDIVFSGSNAVNQSGGINTVDTTITGHSLTINDPSGVDIGIQFGGTLILSGNTGNTGITVGAAAGSLQAEIDANLELSGTPNITVDNSGGLLITGAISGSNGLIVNGTGLLTLTGPGLTAAVNTYAGGTDLVSGTLSVAGDGAFGQSGSGNGVTFNPGAGNSVTLQQYLPPATTGSMITAPNRTFTFASGTGIIDPGSAGSYFNINGPIAGAGALEVVDTGEVIMSGSIVNFNGNAYVNSGTLAISYVGTLGQTGSSAYNIAPGATLVLSTVAAQNLVPAAGYSVAFLGSGTLQAPGVAGLLQVHGEYGAAGSGTYVTNGNVYFDMSGGTIEVTGSGVFENGGLGSTVATVGYSTIGTGSPLWTGSYNGAAFTNLSSLQIDASGTFDTWNGNNVTVDALTGSGVLTRLGYTNAEVGSTVTIGDNNGSGTFSGIITNAYGNLSIVKTGTGTEVFSGSNSYSGSTFINGGVLRVTSNNGLGNGGVVYATGTNPLFAANGTVTVTGSAKLDLYGGVTADKAIVLNGGRLLNALAGSTSVLDNGIAAITFGGAQVGTYTAPTLSATSAGSGTGATFTAGTGTAPAGTAGGGVNVYGEVTNPGSGYTVAPGLAYTDSSGTGSGLTVTAVLSSLTLSGSNNYIGGNGNLTINAAISGTSGFTTTGTGILTVSGSNTYTGVTTLASADTFVNNGYIASAVNVSPTGNAPATLAGNGSFGALVTTAPASGSNVAHIAPGVNSSGNFGAAGTLTFKNGLTIGNGTNLDFDLGSSSDLIAVTGGTLTLGNAIVLNVDALGTLSLNTAYTLFTYSGTSIANASDLSTWTATGAPGGTVNTLFINSGSSITVDFTSSSATPTTYTTLAVSAGASRVIVGGTVGITSSITNTGTGSNDSLAYTGLGASASGGSVSGATASGTLAIGLSGTNSGSLLYTAPGAAGTITITPVVATATNANIGGNAMATGTTTATINVVNNRTITASSVNFGRFILGNTPGSQVSNLSSTAPNSTTATLTVNSGATGSDGLVTVTSGSTQTFDGSNTAGTVTASISGSFGSAGTQTGTANISGAGNLTGELPGQTLTPVSVVYTADPVNNRVITSSTANLGSVFVNTVASKTVTLSSTGSQNQNTTLSIASGSTVSGNIDVTNNTTETFNGTVTSGTLGVSGSFANSGSASGTVNVTTTGEGLMGESDAPVTVAYTVNVFQAYTGTTPASTSDAGSGTAALTLTNLASTDSGQRAGITVSGYSTNNGNFAVTPVGSGTVGIANGSNVTATVADVTVAANRLNGTYNYAGTVTGTAHYTDSALATQASVANQVWNNVTVSATVSGNASSSHTNLYSAQIMSGSSYAGYSLGSSVLVSGTSQHPATGPSGNQTTTASLLGGTASATTTVSMAFDSAPAPGNGPDDSFRTSDILTLTGINQVGTTTEGALTVTLTDEYVLQLTYDQGAGGLEFIGQNTGSGWTNAVLLDSNESGTLFANETYATYLAGTTNGDTPALGAYGYDNGVAWAVLDHTSISDPISEFAVIPEPSTYAMIFSGFGMLVGFQRLRRRSRAKARNFDSSAAA